MIRSFRDKDTARLFEREPVRMWSADLQALGLRKLTMLDAAMSLEDLRSPPGNRLEKPSGRRAGRWSIRINQQWRICFLWKSGDAHEVEIIDYH